MLAISLLGGTIAPVGAIPIGPAALSSKGASLQKDRSEVMRVFAPILDTPVAPGLAPGNYDELTRAIEAIPSASFFSIRVAGPAVAASARSLTNKVAQTSGIGTIAIIYPDIGEPYRSIFTQIIDGIEDKARGRVANIAVGANVDIGELNNSLRHKETKVVIALGRQGMKVAAALDSSIDVVVGGVLTTPENEAPNLQVNSLSPDPALLFARLKGIMPKARRILTVYDPRQNAWMMSIAKEAAHAHGLELKAYKAQDLRSAMLAYQEILEIADSSQDALWLPHDSTTVEDSSVLPLVLQESWTNNLVVFSSSFGHVRRGVLFSLYPNNVELGRHLADSALNIMASGQIETPGMLPLREVLMAINLRTAKHLGLNVGRAESIGMTFPEQ